MVYWLMKTNNIVRLKIWNYQNDVFILQSKTRKNVHLMKIRTNFDVILNTISNALKLIFWYQSQNRPTSTEIRLKKKKPINLNSLQSKILTNVLNIDIFLHKYFFDYLSGHFLSIKKIVTSYNSSDPPILF